MFRFFRRRSGGVSGLFLVLAVCGILSSCGGLVFGVPTSIMRAREVQGLPQPSAAEVSGLAAGTKAIFAAQIPADVATDEVNGLALFYVEERLTGTRTADEIDNPDSSARNWQRVQPPADTIEIILIDGEVVSVGVPSSATFLNSETIPDSATMEGMERRSVGYLPGQTVAIEGTWEGNARITADTFYRGSRADYVTQVRQAPGSILIFSILCGSISFALLIAGGVLRFLGR